MGLLLFKLNINCNIKIIKSTSWTSVMHLLFRLQSFNLYFVSLQFFIPSIFYLATVICSSYFTVLRFPANHVLFFYGIKRLFCLRMLEKNSLTIPQLRVYLLLHRTGSVCAFWSQLEQSNFFLYFICVSFFLLLF